ncbi:MAG: M16 family metallopeptidase [Bacteroidia bacterium]
MDNSWPKPYKFFRLANGLEVFLISDPQLPKVTTSVVYKVGARHEPPAYPGLAHLFEHLMFEDDEIAYDKKIEHVGGTTNAYTSSDATVYYAKGPSDALDLFLSLEAHRMEKLHLSPQKIRIQKHVVAEEFRQRYLQAPYADRFFYLRKTLFNGHPYERMVIGQTPEMILDIPDAAIVEFYHRYYTPQQAALIIVGPDPEPLMEEKVHRYFGDIAMRPMAPFPNGQWTPHPEKEIHLSKPVPQPLIVWAWRLPPFEDAAIPALDLWSDILATGYDAPLQNVLVREKNLANRLQTYLWAQKEASLFILEAYLYPHVDIHAFAKILTDTLTHALTHVTPSMLEAARQAHFFAWQKEMLYSQSRALQMAHFVIHNHPEWFYSYWKEYQHITVSTLKQVAQNFLRQPTTHMYYLPST